MILIDAANVSGGGAVLLQYLADQLTERNIPFFVLKKRGCSLQIAADQVADGDASLRRRGQNLKMHLTRLRPSTLLCFGNFPPPFRTNIRTITYFHNLHYLKDHDDRAFTWKQQSGRYIRRLYLQLFQYNSDAFVVQTPSTAVSFKQTFGGWENRLHVLPFYDEQRISQIRSQLVGTPKQDQTFLYASSSESHKNHINLLNCWERLAEAGIRPTLYLTIAPTSPYTTPALLRQLSHVQNKGANVINLGVISYEEILRHTAQSSYCIFPSLNETLGLGLVEAYWMNNRILTGRRPYVRDVVVPSGSFDPLDPTDIARTVYQALHSDLPMPKLVIKNLINDFVHLLVN